MGAPTKSKTWGYQHYSNPAGTIPAGGLQSGTSTWDGENRMVLYNLKVLLTSGAGAWTVVRSCGKVGGITWTVSGSDNWGSADAVRYYDAADGNRFSWIVLQQAGIATSFQVLISCQSSKDETEKLYAYVSYSAGFSGGSDTARPTATDEYVMHSNAAWCSIAPSSVNRGVSVFMSSDGACTRVYTSGLATLAYVWMFDKPDPAYVKGWWAKPHVCGITVPTYDYVTSGLDSGGGVTSKWSTTIGGFAGVKVALTTPVYADVNYTYPVITVTWFGGTNVNGDWECFPCGIVSCNSSCPGYLGRMFDFWLIPTVLANLDYMDETGSKQFVVLGDILQPSDGSTVVID